MHIQEKKCKVWNDFTMGISLVSDLMQNHLRPDNVFEIAPLNPCKKKRRGLFLLLNERTCM